MTASPEPITLYNGDGTVHAVIETQPEPRLPDIPGINQVVIRRTDGDWTHEFGAGKCRCGWIRSRKTAQGADDQWLGHIIEILQAHR